MDAKIILIEGLPGSGKSTFATRLKNHYEKQGLHVVQLNEGDLHPIDVSWCSITSQEQYQQLLEKYSKYEEQIKNLSYQKGSQIITAYTKVKVDDSDVSLFKDFSQYELYKTTDLQLFTSFHQELYRTVELKKDTIYIFECVYLQNHINELILKYNLSTQDMITYFSTLIQPLLQYQVNLLYIKQENIASTLQRVIEERRSNNPHYKDWIDLVIEYLSQTRFGNELGYTSQNGVQRYFQDRQSVELSIIRKLPVKSHVLHLESDYESVFEEMLTLTL